MVADKLGFTFYPKDWWTSESYFELTPLQRYYYLECLFIMYTNGGYMKTQKTQFENRTRTQVETQDWEIITSKFKNTENGFTHESVNKRLRKALTNKENGKKGGRPPKPKKPNLETQKNPTLEREREREKESEDVLPPPPPSLENDIRFLSIDECRKTYDTYHGAKKETICMAKRLTMEQLAKLQDEFDKGLKTKESSKLVTDYVTHFANWANKEYAQNFIIELKKPQSTNDRAKYAHLGF